MIKQRYLPNDAAARVLWFNNFVSQLGNYAAKYRIAPEEVAQAMADAQWFAQFVSYREQFVSFNKALTKYMNDMMGSTDAQTAPTPPVAAMPQGSIAGIWLRVAAMAGHIKTAVGYAEADGRALGIIGAETTLPDAATHKPALSLRVTSGGFPEVLWTKGEMTAIDLQYLDAAGNWQFMATDTVPDYTDTRALPAAGVAEVRKYRGRYILHDTPYGQWSDVVSITVGG